MLDRQRTTLPYVTGRLVALVESVHNLHKNEFGRVNMDLVFSNPSINISGHLASLKHCKIGKEKWEKELSEILCLVPAEGLPEEASVQEQSTMWVGYYHERKYINDNMVVCETMVTSHNAPLIENASVNNAIDELHK